MTRTSRLDIEYQHMRKLEKHSLYIEVQAIGSKEAPEKYVVTYTCIGVTGVDDKDQPVISQEHKLEIDLKNFPAESPHMKFLTPVYHPGIEEAPPYNVSLNELVTSWDEPGSVARALIHVGHMLQYKLYDNWMNSPLNSKAADWLNLWAKPRGLIASGRPLDQRELVPGENLSSEAGAAQVMRDEDLDARRGAASPSPPTLDPDETVVTARPSDAALVAQGSQEAPVASGTAAAAQGAQADNGQKPKVIFGDLIREHAEPFPVQRLLHWRPTGKKFDVKEPSFSLVVTSEVLAFVNAHVATDDKKELAGFLLGNRYICPNSKLKYVQIDNALEAKHTSSGPVSIELMNETFHQFTDEKGGKYRGKEVIGWYHSHPRMGAFLSTMDVEIHKIRLPAPWTVALVIDPVKRDGGFFCWRDGELHQHAKMDFYELRGIRTPAIITYMPWENYQCFDSQTDEERVPQLAEDAPLHEIASVESASWLPIEWLRKYARPLGTGVVVLLLLIAVASGVILLSRDTEQSSTANSGTKTRGRVDPASNATPGERQQPTVSSTYTQPGNLPQLQAPTTTRIYDCLAYRCKVAATFKDRIEGLRVEVEGRTYQPTWDRNDAIIDLTNTRAMRSLKGPGTASTQLAIGFSDPAHSEVSVQVTLHKGDAIAPINNPPRLSRFGAGRPPDRSTGKASGRQGRRSSGAVDRTH